MTTVTAWRRLAPKKNWFHGAVSFEAKEGGLRPWRIEHSCIEFFEPALLPRAAMPAGVRVTFETDAPALRLGTTLDPINQDPRASHWIIDALVNGKLHSRLRQTEAETHVEVQGLPKGNKRVEFYLSQGAPIRVDWVEVPKGAAIKTWKDPRPRWLVHGSSITHCGAAAGPSGTWAARVASMFDLNHTNLGYGGQCHMDQAIARMMGTMAADYISLCLGINIQGGSSMNIRTFRAAALGFVMTLREAHPRVPIALLSPIFSLPRESTLNSAGMSLQIMREQLADAVRVLRAAGDKNLHYVDGLSVMGPETDKFMPDHLHPSDEGQPTFAANYAKRVMPLLGIKKPSRQKPAQQSNKK